MGHTPPVQRNWTEKLSLIAGENDGYVRTDDMVDRAVSASWLSLLSSQGRLERVTQGLYRVPGWPISRLTQYREAVLWGNRRVVVAGEAALAVWQLCDVNPRKIDLIADSGYRPRKAGGERYRVSCRVIENDAVGECGGVRVLRPFAAIEDATKCGVPSKLIVQAIEVAQTQELVTKREGARLLVGLDKREEH